MSDSMTVFNRSIVRLHRERAANLFADHDFLFREVGERLLERLDDVTHTFPRALDLGARTGLLAEIMGKRGGIEDLFACELSNTMAANSAHKKGMSCVCDEEQLPFSGGNLDLVLSNLALHWVNDLPGTFLQIRKALKPDGLLLGTMFGGDTLHELRSVLSDAEISVEGGISPRVSPFADIRDIGGLLQRSGFALPVVDSETITVGYNDPLKLLTDLRGMGETNAVIERRHTVMRRETLMHALALYKERFADSEGRITATFQILNFSGWAPASTQQQPLRPGTGQKSLTDVFKESDK